MERETTKHGARVDEEMSHDVASLTNGSPVEARSRDERLQETPAAGEAPIDPGRRPDLPMPGGLTQEEIDARAELAGYLERAVFPADRRRLLESALSHRAPDRVLDLVRTLPEGAGYSTLQEVWDALGGHHEHRD